MAELVLGLGTSHTPLDTPFAATLKDYDTPFGPLATDSAFVHDLMEAYRGGCGATVSSVCSRAWYGTTRGVRWTRF